MCRTKKNCHKHNHNGVKDCCGQKKDTCCCFQKKQIEKFNELRRMMPNEPLTLGSSTALQAQEYENMPAQSGNAYSTALKFEYDSNANKYSLPGLDVKATFDLCPSVAEAGSMNGEILDAGYNAFFRTYNSQWYGVTQDEENFYYACWGGTLFSALFGFGTSSIFVARRKSDASLVWVKSQWNYSLDIPKQPTYIGTDTRVVRVALAVFQDRLYITTFLTNIGPQLYVIDKLTGAPVWSMAYYIPEALKTACGCNYLVSSPDLPLNSVDGELFVGSNVAVGDVNLQVVELENGNPSVFVGISSFQNAINPVSLSNLKDFPVYTDQGHLFRIDDLGLTGTIAWGVNTCAEKLKIGDEITTSTNPIDNPSKYNPFRPGRDTVYIWRDTTEDGKFSAPGGVDAAILDYNSVDPILGPTERGYIPIGYPTLNNLTTPAVANVILTGGNPPLTELDVPLVFRVATIVDPNFCGIGGNPVIYQNDFTQTPETITQRLIDWNIEQAGLSPGQEVKHVFWAYLDADTVACINGLADASENVGVRYIASLPDGYVISNDQEAEAINYFGNSVWGQAPSIDIERGLVYFGSGQAHNCPVDELLFYQNPTVEYLDRKQDPINRMYEYARPDSSTDFAPFATLSDVNAAKDKFVADNVALNIKFEDKSPRGNRSYSDAIICADLESGALVFGFRSIPWDAVTFIGDDPSLVVIQGGYVDGDMSSGVQLFNNVRNPSGNYGPMLASMPKASLLTMLDISGLNPNVEFNNENLIEKGLIPYEFYAGPDGVLGGSNYGLSQDGGSQVIWAGGNDASDFGSQSLTYNTGFYQGFEFPVTRDGRALQIHDSMVQSFDVSSQEMKWEVGVGNQNHVSLSVYNGVVYVPLQSSGILKGLDIANGNTMWEMEVFDKYGMSGIATPSFSQGRAVWICNFELVFSLGVTGGTPGHTGLLLDVDPCLLTSPKDTVKSLVGGTLFESFDVTPRAYGETIRQNLVLIQSVTHQWDCAGSLTATHLFADDAPAVLHFDAKNFIYSSNQIIFDNYASQGAYRYISLTLLNRKSYQLKFQHLESGEWVTYVAILDYTSCNPPINAPAPNARPSVVVSPAMIDEKLSAKGKLAMSRLQKRPELAQKALAVRVAAHKK